MRKRIWFSCLVWIAVAAGCRDGAQAAPTLPVAAKPAEATPAAAREVATTSSTREVLAARRAKMIERLRAYRLARVYPTDAAGMPLGVFRDDHGVRCPMSELMYLSGRDDLVDAVVRLDNDLKLADVRGGPLYDWMLESGLTQEEIVQVQGVLEWGLDGGFLEVPIEQTPRLVDHRDQRQEQAREIVDAKLVAAERMLRAGTAASLATATERLASRRERVLAAAK